MGYEAGERDIKEQADLIIKQREAIEEAKTIAESAQATLGYSVFQEILNALEYDK